VPSLFWEGGTREWARHGAGPEGVEGVHIVVCAFHSVNRHAGRKNRRQAKHAQDEVSHELLGAELTTHAYGVISSVSSVASLLSEGFDKAPGATSISARCDRHNGLCAELSRLVQPSSSQMAGQPALPIRHPMHPTH
jgi:hypothetical protein